MKHKLILILISLSIIFLNLVYSQILFFENSRIEFSNFSINDDFTADFFFWSIDDHFLVLDKDLGSIYKFSLFEGTFKPFLNYNLSESFGELIGVLANSSGIAIFDKTRNQIFKLDYELNPITIDILDLPLYSERVTLDSWSRINIYSKRLNGIFIYGNSIDEKKLINLDHVPGYGNCISDMEANDDGDLAVLDCEGEVYVFSVLGKFRFSFPTIIKHPKFLIPYKSNWIVFNYGGVGVNLSDGSKINLPETKFKLKDISIMGNKIALLYNSYISILNVQN